MALSGRVDFWVTQAGLDARADLWGTYSPYVFYNRLLETEAKSYGAVGTRYMTMEDSRVGRDPKGTGDDCFSFNRQVYPIGQFKPVIPRHHGCFLEDTIIHSMRGLIPIVDVVVGDRVLTHKGRYQPVVKTYRSGYRGDIFELNGEGWMTERHPILSGDRWVSAKHLNTGDQISLSKPDNRPVESGKVGLFFEILRALVLGVVPLATVNLNSESDVWKGEVDAEDMEGILRDHIIPIRYENLMKTLLKIRLTTPNLTSDSRFNLCLNGWPRGYNMGSPYLMRPLHRRHLTPLQCLSLASPTDGDIVISQPFSDSPPVNSVTLGECVLADPGEVRINDVFYGKFNSVHKPTPTLLNNIRKESYKGMVYNLDVRDDGSYLIGDQGLAVHNCRCWWDAVWIGTQVGVV